MQKCPFLKVKNLSVRLRGRPVLEGIDWQINKGEQWAIIGPNGSGKTTLAKALAGELPSSGGTIVFGPDQENDRSSKPGRRTVGFVSSEMHRRVFEKDAFAEDVRHFTGDDSRALTVSDFILDRFASVGDTSSSRAVDLAFWDRPGMQELLSKRVSALTSGEISTMLIFKALMNHPQMLVLDEPFNGFDRRSKDKMKELIGGLIRNGLQVILITHQMEDILPEIDHVLIMTADGIQKTGTTAAVLKSREIQRIYGIDHDPADRRILAHIEPVHGLPADDGNDTRVWSKIVEMVDVHVAYGRNVVLRNLNWTIRKGENWLVSGPAGAGKTSLLKLITGDNLQAYANNIYLFGEPKGSGESVWEIKKRIGWISSDLKSTYPPAIRGVEVVYSGFFDSMGLFRCASAQQRQRADEMLAALGIAQLAGKRYGNLSHGQKQMLLIARAIIKSPDLLLLDEPCEGLDFANHRKILEIIEFIGSRTGTAIVYATSDEHGRLPCISHCLNLVNQTAVVSTVRC